MCTICGTMTDNDLFTGENNRMKTPGNEQVEHRETSLIVRFPGQTNRAFHIMAQRWVS